jgi:hypothetical protein
MRDKVMSGIPLRGGERVVHEKEGAGTVVDLHVKHPSAVWVLYDSRAHPNRGSWTLAEVSDLVPERRALTSIPCETPGCGAGWGPGVKNWHRCHSCGRWWVRPKLRTYEGPAEVLLDGTLIGKPRIGFLTIDISDPQPPVPRARVDWKNVEALHRELQPEHCRRDGRQTCHSCPDWVCCDNDNPDPAVAALKWERRFRLEHTRRMSADAFATMLQSENTRQDQRAATLVQARDDARDDLCAMERSRDVTRGHLASARKMVTKLRTELARREKIDASLVACPSCATVRLGGLAVLTCAVCSHSWEP